MKRKVIYTLTTLVLITAAFFVGKTTAPTVQDIIGRNKLQKENKDKGGVR